MFILRFILHLVMKTAAKCLHFSSKYELRSQALLAELQVRSLQVISKQPEFSLKSQEQNPNSYVFMKRGALLDMVSAMCLSVERQTFSPGKTMFSPMAQSKKSLFEV